MQKTIKLYLNQLSLNQIWPWLAGWLLVMTMTPVVGWVAGVDAQIQMINLGVVAQAALVFRLIWMVWPAKVILRLLLMIVPITWFAEFVGSQTGFPFGRYHYTALLQPQLLNVPLLIPLAWFMMLPPAWAIAQGLVSRKNRWVFAAAAGLVFTAWDLYLDPQMVMLNLWQWDQPGLYFGIPIINYFGWWLVSTVVTLVVSPPEFDPYLLAAIYTLIWLLQVVALGIFWGQPGPALVGFVGMGIGSVLFWRKYHQRLRNGSQ